MIRRFLLRMDIRVSYYIFLFLVVSANVVALAAPAQQGGVLLVSGDNSTVAQSNPANPIFLPPVMYDTSGYDPDSVAVTDVNGDGQPDLIVANLTSDPSTGFAASTVSVLLGNGDGTFQPARTFASGGSYLNSLTVADVNHDGKPDILVGNGCAFIRRGTCSAHSAVGVLLGNGDGTFRKAVNFNSGGYGFFNLKIAVADVNGDGQLDVVALNGCVSTCDPLTALEGSVDILLGNGDGTFRAPTSYLTGGYFANGLALADLNGDGTIDLVVTNYCGDNNIVFCSTPGPVGVLLGAGDGTFKAVAPYGSGGQGTASVAIHDVDGDGNPDLVVGDCGSEGCGAFWPPRPGGVLGVLRGKGDGTFSPAVTYGSGSYFAVAVADVDGDTHPDIIAIDLACASGNSGCVSLLIGNGDGTFQDGSAYALGTGFSAIAVADVNGDGEPDVIATPAGNGGNNTPPGTVGVLLNAHVSTIKSATVATLVSSLNPSVYGQKVTWTATVTTSGPVPPTGKVNFTWGRSIGVVALNANGVATLTRSNLNADTYPLTAVYVGDASNLGSASSIVNQVIMQATTSATLTSLSNPSALGQAVTFTATITSPTVTPTGPVTFAVGKTVLGTVQLSKGKATLTTSALAMGSSRVTATFYGDSNIAKSSASVTQVVH